MTTLTAPTAPMMASTDPYARAAELDDATADALATRLETRAAEPHQRVLRQSFLSRIPRRADISVLEVGCGTGIVARELTALAGVVEVVGVDPSPRFIERARASIDRDVPLRFEVADGRALPFDDGAFDVVVFATTLCHVVDPVAALDEAFRVLTPGGTLLVFDGDYATTTVALSADDPLQACVTAALARLVHDPWLVRSLCTLVTQAGFTGLDMESHGYVETRPASYTPTIVDFGADRLADEGVVSRDAAEALKAEVRRRVDTGMFFGHIAYASLLASRPVETMR